MANQNDILWELKPHSQGKHAVLREYLKAWLPILGKSQDRILFIDGFAGPGHYIDGEEGSPLIALRAFSEHAHRSHISAEIKFIFIEKSEARADYLCTAVDRWKATLPPNCDVHVITGSFDETMTIVLDALSQQSKQLAPAFVMLDPFGVKDTPMDLISRILQNPKSEIYVSFMYESINRFKGTDEFACLDRLFGTTGWRCGLDIEDSEERKAFFYRLYERQLRAAGADYVLHFDILHGQRLVYAIFFATQHPLGCDRMKQAIWRVSPDGDFAFRAAQKGQLKLDLAVPNFEPLKQQLLDRFQDQGWISIAEVLEFVASDQTPYHTSQVKKNALKPMEIEGSLQVDPLSRKKRNTYPEGTRLRFVS